MTTRIGTQVHSRPDIPDDDRGHLLVIAAKVAGSFKQRIQNILHAVTGAGAQTFGDAIAHSFFVLCVQSSDGIGTKHRYSVASLKPEFHFVEIQLVGSAEERAAGVQPVDGIGRPMNTWNIARGTVLKRPSSLRTP